MYKRKPESGGCGCRVILGATGSKIQEGARNNDVAEPGCNRQSEKANGGRRKVKLYTSYYGKIKALDKAGIVPIAISVSIPDWATVDRENCWFKALAPHHSMIKMPMAEYIPKYNEILSGHNPVAVCNMIKKMADGKDAALLCWEKDADECHRKLVAEWLNKSAGTHIEEFGIVKPETDQETFFDRNGGMSDFIDRAVEFMDS